MQTANEELKLGPNINSHSKYIYWVLIMKKALWYKFYVIPVTTE